MVALAREDRLDEALAAAEAMIASAPAHFAGYSAKASVLEAMGDLPQAVACASLAVAREPSDAALRFLRAELRIRAGALEDAVADLDEAESLDDGLLLHEILLQRAEASLLLGDYATARADCARLPEDFRSLGAAGESERSKDDILAEIARREAGGG